MEKKIGQYLLKSIHVRNQKNCWKLKQSTCCNKIYRYWNNRPKWKKKKQICQFCPKSIEVRNRKTAMNRKKSPKPTDINKINRNFSNRPKSKKVIILINTEQNRPKLTKVVRKLMTSIRLTDIRWIWPTPNKIEKNW